MGGGSASGYLPLLASPCVRTHARRADFVCILRRGPHGNDRGFTISLFGGPVFLFSFVSPSKSKVSPSESK